MSTVRFPPIADLLPHAAPMILVDEIVEASSGHIVTASVMRPDHRFRVPDRGVPAHLGIELMAQSCGVFAGLETFGAGRPIPLGFLLGTRRYQASVPWFADGTRLVVRAQSVFREGRMGVFDCVIQSAEDVVARAQLTVYQLDESLEDWQVQVAQRVG